MEQGRHSVDIRGRMRDYSQPPVRRSVTRRLVGQDMPARRQKPTQAHIVQKPAPTKTTVAVPVPAVRRVPMMPAAPSKATKQYPSKPRQSRSHVLKRHAIKTPAISAPAPKTYKRTKKQKSTKRSLVITAMAAIVFLSGIYASWHTWHTNREVVAGVRGANSDTRAPAAGEMSGDETPDETDVTPDQFARYVVAPSLPRYLTIEKLGVKSRVLRMGLTRDGALDTPKNIYDTGWYEGSVKPGESSGATLIDGHVYGPTKSAVFSRLDELNNGDVIDIERGDGLHVRYQVAGRDVYEKDQTDMAKAMRSFDPKKPGLNLITCHGKYSRSDQTYDKRLVIYAVAL